MKLICSMISAIVLAAGQSKRMPGKNKMFLPFNDTTIINNVLAELVISNVDEILVVTDSAEHINDLAIISKVRACINPNPEKGLTSSIQTGVRNIKLDYHFMICLGDMPLIRDTEYNYLINRFLNTDQKGIIQPSFNSKPGNPVLFSANFRQQVLDLTDADGCKPIVQKHRNKVTLVEMTNDSIHLDIDTEEDYRTILNRISKP